MGASCLAALAIPAHAPAGLLVDGDLFLKAARRLPLSSRMDQLLSQGAQRCFVSVVSTWRLLMRERAGLEALPRPVLQMLQGERSMLGFQSLPLDEACLIHLDQLQDLHLAPWDQLMICQAIEHRLQLLSERPIFRSVSLKDLRLQVID